MARTSAGKFVHFLSDQQMNIKMNFVKEQKKRIDEVCNASFRQGSLKRLFDLLVENAYPRKNVEKITLFFIIEIKSLSSHTTRHGGRKKRY